MHTSHYTYHDDGQALEGFLAYDKNTNKPRPGVMVVHDWTGRNDFVGQKAQLLAEMGYIGFAVDMYGQGRTGSSMEEKKALMEPFVNDRMMLRKRILAAFDAFSAMPEVDTSRIAVIGYCFGGRCALDLARAGANLKGAVTFHGTLDKPVGLKSEPIKAKILALHGYDDPMVKPEQVNAFCQEMTQAKVDWQVHMYGNVQHSFTNPAAHDASVGLIYNEVAAQRSWLAMTNFLEEIFRD